MSTDSTKIKMTKKNLPLSNVSKPPSNLSSRRSMVSLHNWKADLKLPLTSRSNQEDLESFVDNLSTIVKRSEQSLIASKPGHPANAVRRTSSLHLTSREPFSNSQHEKLIDKNTELSRSRESIAMVARRSLRNVERFSGIKCSLPSNKSTIPKVCKTFDKQHVTPTKTKTSNPSSSIEPHPVTPVAQKGQTKSPWRLRFEKFLNHQELTPLSPANQSVALPTDKSSSMNKENRTPSFRLPGRRTSKIHTMNK